MALLYGMVTLADSEGKSQKNVHARKPGSDPRGYRGPPLIWVGRSQSRTRVRQTGRGIGRGGFRPCSDRFPWLWRLQSAIDSTQSRTQANNSLTLRIIRPISVADSTDIEDLSDLSESITIELFGREGPGLQSMIGPTCQNRPIPYFASDCRWLGRPAVRESIDVVAECSLYAPSTAANLHRPHRLHRLNANQLISWVNLQFYHRLARTPWPVSQCDHAISHCKSSRNQFTEWITGQYLLWTQRKNPHIWITLFIPCFWAIITRLLLPVTTTLWGGNT